MNRQRIRHWHTWLLALAAGATMLVTSATCNPLTAGFGFYRDDDGYFEDGYIVDETIYYYDDCYFDCF